MKFQDKFYDIIVHNKCPFSEKDDEKCILRKSDFHQILPTDVLDQVNEACGRALIWAGVIRVTFCRPSTECDRRRVGSRKAGGGWARI